MRIHTTQTQSVPTVHWTVLKNISLGIVFSGLSISSLYAQTSAVKSAANSPDEKVCASSTTAATCPYASRLTRKRIDVSSISGTESKEIKFGEKITLGTPALEGYNYEWIVDGELYATTSTIKVQPAHNTVYIRKTTDEISGRIASDQVQITVKNNDNYMGLK